MSTIRIHTYVPKKNIPDREKVGESHAWVSLEKEGKIRDFSLYPTDQGVVEAGQERGWNGSGTNVREGMDKGRPSTETLSQEITSEQEAAFMEHLARPQTYSSRNNNCAHFASGAWMATTGQDLSVKHQGDSFIETGRVDTYETPIGLENSIAAKKREIESLSAERGKPAANTPSVDATPKPPAKKLHFAGEERAAPERTNAPQSGEQAKAGKTLSFFEDNAKSNTNDRGR